MKSVRNTILENWDVDLQEYESVFQPNHNELKSLYKLYDKYAFYNQIEAKRKEEKVSIVFQEEYPPDVDISRLCGIRYYRLNGVKVYNFTISPWIIARISNLTEKQRESLGLGDREKNFELLLAFEHQLTHLIFLLWDRKEFDIHGKLFKCIHDSFFNENGYKDIISVISTNMSYTKPSPNHGRYTYWSNSCYLDSLSSVLYFCKSPVFRDAIFTTNVDIISYKTKNKPPKFINPCDRTMMEIEFVDLTQKMQSSMFNDYLDMLNGDIKKCNSVRNILHECLPEIKNADRWSFYSAADTYDLISTMFPRLLTVNYPYTYHSEKTVSKRVTSDQGKSMFTFWDFIGSELNESGDEAYTRIDWDNIKSDILVFRNGGIPSIKNFGDDKPEIVNVAMYEKGVASQVGIKLFKERYFSEYIIKDKYEMVGAIVLHGTVIGKSGGVHYTSYVKISDKWVEYNDTGNIWRYTENNGSFPENVLSEKKKTGVKPELYFYQKI